jgi:hypothetical protein
MRAGRLYGAVMRHAGVEKDITVLWCKSAAERDVSAWSRSCCKPLAHSSAAELAPHHQQLLSAKIKTLG